MRGPSWGPVYPLGALTYLLDAMFQGISSTFPELLRLSRKA
jgi:hypothetical protein